MTCQAELYTAENFILIAHTFNLVVYIVYNLVSSQHTLISINLIFRQFLFRQHDITIKRERTRVYHKESSNTFTQPDPNKPSHCSGLLLINTSFLCDRSPFPPFVSCILPLILTFRKDVHTKGCFLLMGAVQNT